MLKHLLTKTSLLLCALIAGGASAWAETAKVTLDFTSNTVWKLPTTKVADGTENSYTNVYTIKLGGGTSGAGYGYNNTGYLIMGKNGCYMTLPAFDFAVSKIVITGRSGASTSVKQNIFVGGTAVSTETTGATGSNTYEISSDYQEAGNVFTFKVTSAHNTQVTKVEIFEAASPVDLTSFAFSTANPSVQLVKNGSVFEASYTQTVTADPAEYDGAVTYSIDYEDANTTLTDEEAVIDDETGEVTISLTSNKAGSVVVKATGAATAAYNAPADATYTLSVTTADLTLGAPVFSPAAGAYYYGQVITASALNSSFINYTDDGSTDPDDNSDSFPVGGYTLTGDVTLKAIAFDEDINASAITTAAYTLKAPEAPAFSLSSGEVKAGTTVTLTAGEGGSIVVYTTDGTAPTASSDIYDGPIAINAAMTIKAATVDDGDNLSAIASVSFTIKQVDEFVKVTDAGTLRAGDQLLIVCEKNNCAMGTISSSVHSALSVTISSNTVEDPEEGVAVLTLGGSEGAWTLKSSITNNYLSETGYSNELKESETADANGQKWSISITSGDAKIINLAYPTRSESQTTDRYIQYNYNSGNPRFAAYYSSQTAVQLYRLSKSVTITAAEYATYSGPKNLNFDGLGIKAYKAKATESSVSLTEVERVPANTPVILYKEGLAETTTFNVPVVASADAVSDNDLLISDGTTAKGDDIYVLANKSQGVGFYRWASDNSLSAGRVYLQIAGAGAREFIGFNDEQTGIAAIDNGQWTMDNCYNLSGQRVSSLKKGLYIKNGRKYIVK